MGTMRGGDGGSGAAPLALMVAVASGLLFASAAKAVVFCAKKKNPNKVTVRGVSCTKNEDSLPLPAGPPGAMGDKGDPGQPGAPGSARAYAVVRSDGTLDTARTKNILSVRHSPSVAQGVWCLTPAAGIDPATTPAVVSVDFNDSLTGLSDRVEVRSDPHFDCNANEFEVVTTHDDGTSDSFQNKGFVLLVP